MLYAQLISFKDDEFSAVGAHSEEEACKLIEAGFEYDTEFEIEKSSEKEKSDMQKNPNITSGTLYLFSYKGEKGGS